MTASTEFVVAPLTPAVGGLVSGVDLSRPLSERTVHGLRKAVAERHVLFFQNQTFEAAAQRDFASRFGRLHVHPVYRHVEGVPEITLIETTSDSLPDNDNWHTDVTFIETPPFGAVLTPKVLPPSGGDTLWSSTVAAYDALSEPIRRLVDGLTAEHDFQHGFKRYLWGVGDRREAWEKAVAPHALSLGIGPNSRCRFGRTSTAVPVFHPPLTPGRRCQTNGCFSKHDATRRR